MRSRRSGRCRSTSSTARRRSTRRSRSCSSSGRAPIYLVNFTQRERAELAQSLTSVRRSPTREEREAHPRGASATSASTRRTARTCSASSPRHRHPPRGPAAQVPPAGRAARAAGPAQGDLRHRHARRRRQHPDPHRALHPALQVRRREDRHPHGARLQADRRARRPQGLRRPRAAWWRRRPST